MVWREKRRRRSVGLYRGRFVHRRESVWLFAGETLRRVYPLGFVRRRLLVLALVFAALASCFWARSGCASGWEPCAFLPATTAGDETKKAADTHAHADNVCTANIQCAAIPTTTGAETQEGRQPPRSLGFCTTLAHKLFFLCLSVSISRRFFLSLSVFPRALICLLLLGLRFVSRSRLVSHLLMIKKAPASDNSDKTVPQNEIIRNANKTHFAEIR